MMDGVLTHWAKAVAYAVMIGAITIAIAFAVSVVVNPTPATISQIDHIPAGSFCVGSSLDVNLHIKTVRPVTLYVNTAVGDDKGIINMALFDNDNATLHYPTPAEFNQRVTWKVPDLPFGHYTRIVSVRSLIDFTHPAYFTLPFVVSGDCPK
jgi:hypothetical protein